MFVNVDHRTAGRAWLTIVSLCLQVSTADTTYAQSKDRAARELKPIDVANACLARGDNVCVVRALEGKAKTAMELGLLIETYRALEEPEQARPAMEQYVQHFPDASRAPAYRRMLETMPRSSSTQSTGSQKATPAPQSSNVQNTAPATVPQSAPPTVDARGAAKAPLEEANKCRAADDVHCVVRALEGKAQTAEELGMLCEAYRELGDNKRARAAMQQYVDRFPSGSFSAFYREQLARGR